MLEQRRPIAHVKQLLLAVLDPRVIGNLGLPRVGMLVAPLEEEGHHQPRAAKGKTEAETGVVLGLLRLEVHETTDDAADVADAVHEGDADGTAGRGRDVVGVPRRGGGLDGVDADDGEHDGEVGDAALLLEGTV